MGSACHGQNVKKMLLTSCLRVRINESPKHGSRGRHDFTVQVFLDTDTRKPKLLVQLVSEPREQVLERTAGAQLIKYGWHASTSTGDNYIILAHSQTSICIFEQARIEKGLNGLAMALTIG